MEQTAQPASHMQVDLACIPDVIKLRPQWVTWQYINKTDKQGNVKPTKVPFNARTGQAASSTDPSTWSDFATAVKAATARKHTGIGYVFSADDPFVGIDYDDSLAPDGTILPWVDEVICSLNSYAEISPSGTGIKQIVEGSIPKSLKRATMDGGGAIEIYNSGRFFTITGQHIDGTPKNIQYANGTLDALYKRVKGPETEKPTPRLVTYAQGSYEREYALKQLANEATKVAVAIDNGKHYQLLDSARTCAGFLPHISEDEIFNALHAAIVNRAADIKNADKTILDGIAYGKDDPLPIPEPRQPLAVYDDNGVLYCATHNTALFHVKDKDVWGCGGCLDAGIKQWWKAGDPVTQKPVAVKGYVDLDTGEILEPFEPVVPLYENELTVDMPPLAIDIDFDAGRNAGKWLNAYVQYSQQVSPQSPYGFHETAGLWLCDVAIARRLYVKMPFGDIYPNLFVIWIASTTVWGKTTSMNAALRIARKAFPHLLAPQEMTPETMVSEMAGKLPSNEKDLPDEELELLRAERDFAGQRAMMLDEISGLVNGAAKEYNAGLIEAFMRLYECDERYVRSTKTGGRIVVKNAYLSMLGASTPSIMAQHFANEAMWSNGWWPRFAIITPDTASPPDVEPPDEIHEHPRLVQWLHRIYDRLPRPRYPNMTEPTNVPLTADALAVWKTYRSFMRSSKTLDGLDEKLKGTYGRMPVQVLKIATILATMDWTEETTPVIDYAHIVRAIEIAESWRASAHRVLCNASGDVASNIRRRVIRLVVRSEPDGITLRDLHRMMKDVRLSDLKNAVLECVELGEIETVRTQGRGRPTDKYRCPRG